MDLPAPMGRRGFDGAGVGRAAAGVIVVAVGVVVVAVEVVVVVGNEGVKSAANNLWDEGRSYGGPKGEGRLVMQRGENGKRGSEGGETGSQQS
jgi:hypothetical protein